MTKTLVSLIALLLVSFVSCAAGQVESLTPPERAWIPMLPFFVPRFAHELDSDNERSRLALRGPVKTLELIDLSEIDPDQPNDDPIEPDRLFLEFDEHGRYNTMRYTMGGGDALVMKFTVQKLDTGVQVACAETGFATLYTVVDGRVASYDITSMGQTMHVKIEDRHENGVARRISASIEGEAQYAAEFSPDGRVSKVFESGLEELHVWGIGILTVNDAGGKATIMGTIDQYGNMTKWSMPDMFSKDPGAGTTMRSLYTYDKQGNWTSLVVENRVDDTWRRVSQYKRNLTYFTALTE
jgi:hypothetical protein